MAIEIFSWVGGYMSRGLDFIMGKENEMLKRVMILAVALIFVLPVISQAMDMTGKYGLGYFRNQAPVGARYWFGPQAGIDVGVGFELDDLGDETASSFWIEAGLPLVIVDTERANFMLRPGVMFGSLDARPYGIDSEKKWTKIVLSVMPVAEVFFGQHFSLEAGHGLEVEIVSYPDEDAFGGLAGESFTHVRSLAASITHIGFHFYFK
jgi:hypothetical protein